MMLASFAVPQTMFVPPHLASVDARSAVLLPGMSAAARLQLLVDPGLLPTTAPGQAVTALSFRRDFAFEKPAAGGAADLRVTLSISPGAAAAASEVFAANAAAQASGRTIVFQGTVTAPSSAAPDGRTPDWNDPQDVVSITFQTPFVYSGGTLCIDIWGTPAIAGGAPYWPVDAAVDSIAGQVTPVGHACGSFGGQWQNEAEFVSASVGAPSLVPGSSARFRAFGARNMPGAVLVGTVPVAFDLHALGVGEDGCFLYVGDPIVLPLLFTDRSIPAFTGGEALLPLHMPTVPAFAGSAFRIQFLELSTPLRTSNALDCVVASRPANLEMASVFAWSSAGSEPQTGRVDPAKAPVVRLTFQ
jgi:hypothetical protein